MGRGGTIMLLGDADLVELPQAADFVLGLLEDMEVNIFDPNASFYRFSNKLMGDMPFGPE